MADPQARVVPEDETFLTDEELFNEEVERRYGLPAEDDEPVDPETADVGAPPEEALQPGEAVEREAAPETSPAATSPAAAQPPTPEWWEHLPDDAKAAFEAHQRDLVNLRRQYDAVHGRLAPVQQENARLRERLASAPPARPQNPGPQAGQQPSGFSLSDVEGFEELRAALPEEAKIMEAAFGRQSQTIQYLQSQLSAVSHGLQDMQQNSFAQQHNQELAQLSEAHPDWATIHASTDFNQWLGVQPPTVAQLVNSPRAKDCIWLLDRYRADAYLMGQLNGNGSAPPAQPAPPARGSLAARQTRTLRQQTRSTPSLDPQQFGVGAPNGDPSQFMSEEEIWDAEVERRLRAQREANNRR